MAEIDIGNHLIGPGNPCFIIAEAGVNHNGDLELAKQLVDIAADAGADAVKFQTFRADAVVTARAPKAAYQKANTDVAESQLAMLRHLEISREAHKQLQQRCRLRGILMLSTPFDRESASFLVEMGVPVLKIASGEITNLPFLRYLAALQHPLILSTGMCYLEEVEVAVRALRETGGDQIALLHCVSNYPTDPSDVNLRAMETLAEKFSMPIGYSDHTPGIEIPLAAVALGASVIEKHFTVARNLPGPDHSASLEPGELKEMVAAIRSVESALGHGRKEPAGSEFENRSVVRRSLAAAVDLPVGSILAQEQLTELRPGDGISPAMLDQVVGRRLIHARLEGELIALDDLE